MNKSVENVPPSETDPLTLHHEVGFDFPPTQRDNLSTVLTRNPGQFGGIKMADQGLTEKEPGRRQYRRYKTNFPATLTTYPIRVVGMKFERVLEGVSRTDKGQFFACVDMRDVRGSLYDLDVYVRKTDQGLKTAKLVIHKVDGEERPKAAD